MPCFLFYFIKCLMWFLYLVFHALIFTDLFPLSLIYNVAISLSPVPCPWDPASLPSFTSSGLVFVFCLFSNTLYLLRRENFCLCLSVVSNQSLNEIFPSLKWLSVCLVSLLSHYRVFFCQFQFSVFFKYRPLFWNVLPESSVWVQSCTGSDTTMWSANKKQKQKSLEAVLR